MNGIEIHRKKLCMTELETRHSVFESKHYYDAGAGCPHSGFVYIVCGRLTVKNGSKTLLLQTGDLFYIPEGIRYTAVWQGKPNIDYYTFNIVSGSYDSSLAAGGFAMQKLEQLSLPETGVRFAEIFRLIGSEGRSEKIRGLSLFYDFYADALTLLRPAVPEKYSPVLIKAIDYIEAHYAENFGVSELAAACFISESRLHHLFTEKLGRTPVGYRNEIRAMQAAHLLRTTSLLIEEISAAVGFHSPAYFREAFKDQTGMRPTEYRKLSGTENR